MKVINKIVSVLLCAIMFMFLMPSAAAAGETGTSGIWKYKVLGDGTLSITGCTSTFANMTLPGTLNISSVPVAVTRIENDAFKVTSPIFFPSNIETFVMPESVKSIGDNAFYLCDKLTSVTFSQNLQSIGASAFYCCSALTGAVIPDSVTSIGSAAFSGCSALGSVTLPNNPGFTNIPDNLFNGDISLTTINNIVSLTNLESIGSQAFLGSSITSIVLPDSITSIGNGAFNDCELLKSVTLPDNAAFTSIPAFLFFECSILESITIPESVTSIGDDAFNGCYVLEDITIPENVASIGRLAFVSCTSLKAINVDANNPYFSSEDGVLYNAGKTEFICCPAGWSGTLHIPDGVSSIHDNALYQCAGLEEVYIPASVLSIGDYAFDQCSNLTATYMSEGIQSIGQYAFNSCGSLSYMALPESLQSIGKSAFMSCESLRSIIIPENVSSIGTNAFAFCSDLSKAVILGGSTAFGSDVFLYAAIATDGVYGRSSSTAQTYASAHSTPFYTVRTISFNTKGGTAVSDIYTGEGKKISEPVEPTLSGSIFDGWYKDSSCTDGWDFGSDTISGDVTLYAKWSIAQVPTYALTVTAGTGGRIVTGGSGNYAAGTVITISASADAGYSFDKWTSTGGGSFGDASSAATTFTMPSNAAASTASFKYTGGGSVTPANPPPTDYKADITGTDAAGKPLETNIQITVDANKDTAAVDLSALSGNLLAGDAPAVITIPSIPNVDTYTLGIPADRLSVQGGTGSLTLHTDAGSLTITSGMLSGVASSNGTKAEITIGQGDKSGLPEAVTAAIGDRPLVQLTLKLDGKQTEWNNPGAPVTVSIPYTPTAAELLNPESIVIWYIDGSGNAVSVPNGHYDPATGAVVFSTTHFSDYAVGFNQVGFNDVAAGVWYGKAVSFIAARGITTGTGNGNYSPGANLTRGEFIVQMMRAYGIAPDNNPTDNFSDAGNTYYTGYLAAAKRMGISAGIDSNMFAPEKVATRQEMFTLLYNALKAISSLPQDEKLPDGSPGMTLDSFSDAGQISAWALAPMTLLVKTGAIGGNDGVLNPTGTATRAEMAQMLYKLLSK